LYSSGIKRFIDISGSFFLLVILSPILLISAITVKSTSKGPVFFTQLRVGKDLKTFRVFKFRTMTDKKHKVEKIYGKSDHITAVGYYLRRFKLDELPQLVNVLIGDMSLVGPRPGVPEQLEEMTKKTKKRYSVRPGITGLAQVSGNIYLDWEDRFVFDLIYIKNITFLNDLKIIVRTAMLIIVGEKNYVNKPLIINMKDGDK